jgi:hypothetical protein
VVWVIWKWYSLCLVVVFLTSCEFPKLHNNNVPHFRIRLWELFHFPYNMGTHEIHCKESSAIFIIKVVVNPWSCASMMGLEFGFGSNCALNCVLLFAWCKWSIQKLFMKHIKKPFASSSWWQRVHKNAP